MRTTVSTLILLIGLGTLVGCAQVPTAQLDAAQKAMDDAQKAEAPTYAADAWAKAEDADAQLQAELKAQQDAYAVSRSYEKAKTLAADTKAAAEQATADALTGKETARNDATKAIEETKALLVEVRDLVAHAPQGKGSRVDLAAFRADTDPTEASLKDAQAAFDAGRFAEAKSKADAAREVLEGIKSQIKGAEKRVGQGTSA